MHDLYEGLLKFNLSCIDIISLNLFVFVIISFIKTLFCIEQCYVL